MNQRFVWFLCAWAAIASGNVLHGTESQGTPGPRARLTAKGAVGDITTPLSVPVYLETFSDTNLKSFTYEVSYPPEALTFMTAVKGFLLEAPEFSLAVNPVQGSSDKLRTVRITVSNSGSENAIPQGVIFYMHFSAAPKMAEEIKKKSEGSTSNASDSEHESITLQSSLTEAQTVDGSSLSRDQLAAEDEPVVLFQVVPLSACYFYMH